MKHKNFNLQGLISYCMALLISLNYACDQTTNKNTVSISDEEEVKTSQEDKQENFQIADKLFFKADGSEPGWSIEINKKADHLYYKLQLDNGNLVKEGNATLQRLDKSNYLNLVLVNELETIDSKINLTECFDNAGNSRHSSIVLRYKQQSYNGCGTFFMDTGLYNELRTSNTIDYYICYKNNQNENQKIWIGFNKEDIALKVKYKGQAQGIVLEYNSSEYIEGGAHPTLIKYYNEIYGGKINGVYKTIHSGNWDYVEYQRGKDSANFNFTIDHELHPYSKHPCF
ncbi:hypothetical protein ACE939_03710 [Aquimarina sp. W85]|uniref:hypothetical protein n=1 Tax=Aquimarina rhodophyticola TaxID=3342246 RepID=UPI00366D4AEF